MHHVLKQFIKVYQMLEDEESRDIYLKKLDVLVSGNLKYTDDIAFSYLQSLPDRNEQLAAAMEKMKETLPAERNLHLSQTGGYDRNPVIYQRTCTRI